MPNAEIFHATRVRAPQEAYKITCIRPTPMFQMRSFLLSIPRQAGKEIAPTVNIIRNYIFEHTPSSVVHYIAIPSPPHPYRIEKVREDSLGNHRTLEHAR